jgi:hypothetical protein
LLHSPRPPNEARFLAAVLLDVRQNQARAFEITFLELVSQPQG